MRVLVYDADRCWNIRRKECECSVSRSWLLHAGSLASMKAKLCYFNCTTNTSLCHGESDIPNFRLITISDVKCRTKLITDLSTQSDVPREVKQPLREVFTDWRKPVRSVVRNTLLLLYTIYIWILCGTKHQLISLKLLLHALWEIFIHLYSRLIYLIYPK